MQVKFEAANWKLQVYVPELSKLWPTRNFWTTHSADWKCAYLLFFGWCKLYPMLPLHGNISCGDRKERERGGGNKDWEERFLFLPPPHWKSFVLAGVESCLLFPPLSCFFHIWSPLAFFSVPISIIGLLHPVNKACRQSKLLLEKYHRHGSFTSKNCEKASKVSSKIDGVAQLLQLTSQ